MAKKAKAAQEQDDGRDEGAKSESKRKADLLKRAKERYEVITDYWRDNHKLALEDIRFRAGDQWPEEIKSERDKASRPALVLDKLNQYIRQVVNDGRQNRPAIKYRPKGDGDQKVAGAFEGLTRAILNASNADQAFDTALDHSAGHGFGYFRVLTEYDGANTFDQKITVERVRNSLAVKLAPHQSADGCDAEDGFIEDTMSRAAFKAKFPKAQKADWKADAGDFGDGWLGEDEVRVVEYFYKVPTVETIYQLADGVVVTKEEYEKALAEGIQDMQPVVNMRQAHSEQVKWCKMTGAEILEERDWAGKFIPIISVYGTETDVNGKVTYSGLTRPGRDGQMLYNFARTAFAERVALTPKAPFIAAAGQTEDDPNWQRAHIDNIPVLTYNPVEVGGQVLGAPQRQPASDIPAGFAQEMQAAEHDIQSALGMYAASLGQPSNEKSGRAIIARQREGDVATFHYHDNLNRAIRYLGRILIDLIPKIYDSRRVVRLMEEDGTTREAMIAPELGAPAAKLDGMEAFNLGAGEYDVEVDTGPSYTTKRQEALEAQIEIASGNPTVWQTHGDIIAKNMDWPGAEAWAARTRATMPPELSKAIAEAERADEDGLDPKVRDVLAQAEAAIEERERALEQATDMIEQAKERMGQLEAEVGRARQDAETAAAKSVLSAEAKAARAQLDLRDEKLVAELLRVQEETIEAVKALVMPEPSIAQPAPVEPAGPSPEIMAILEAFNGRTQALVDAVRAPRRRVAERDELTGLVTGFVEGPIEPAYPQDEMMGS
ncbi:MAG TPA: portal protein [Rhodospirillales bacterium]|nr:portal protein [Rhodospirillales bacterium]